MGYLDVANSKLLYLLVGIGILYIVGLSLVFLRKAWRRSLDLGVSRKKLVQVARSSAVFTVVPSLSIIIGLFSLSAVLGIPWPWYRLSVVGSVTYELTAAEMVADGMGYPSAAAMAGAGDYRVFGAVMFVMSICILGGIIINLFAVKRIQTSLTRYKTSKGDWGTILPGCFFLAIMAAFTPLMFTSGLIYALTFCTSILVTGVQYLAIQHFGLLRMKSFVMSISLVVSMGAAVLFTQLFS